MKTAGLLLFLLACAVVSLSGDTRIHVVEKNDTLYSLSREYNISVDALKKANNIEDEHTLKIGSKLLIPSVHEVEKGDTLWSIARSYDTTVDDLVEINELPEDHILKIGELLLIMIESDGTEEVADDRDSQTQGQTESTTNSIAFDNNGSADDQRRDNSIPFWPLDGEHAVPDGKLPGTWILGEKRDAVVTIASGTVVWSAPYRGFGKVLIIEAADHHLYIYGGNDEVLVSLGDKVTAGMQIASLGVNPHTGDARLYFSVIKNNEYVDPQKAPRG